MDLSHAEQQRYSRQLLLPEVGPAGQSRLQAARVLCVGAGGLGSPALLYLAAAGIGHLGIVDDDVVDVSNLQRQIVHGTPDVGRNKTDSAREALRRLNPEIEVVVHATRLRSGNAQAVLQPYDVVIDGSDNLGTRYLTNDACVLLGKPNVYGAVHRFEGQASVFFPQKGGPCYRCLYPEPPPPGMAPSCAEAGVLGVLPGIIGTIQAVEALKLILGQGRTLVGRLLLLDALEMRFRELKVRRDPLCPLCGERPTITGLVDLESSCGSATPATALAEEVTIEELKRALDEPALGIQVFDVREPGEYEAGHLPGVRSLPLSQLESRLAELDPGQAYYVHCRSGQRSLQALRLLRTRGFLRVQSVRGGGVAWAAAGRPASPQP